MNSARRFERAFTATPADIDELGHVNNAAWVRWIQDLSTDHWRSAADQVHVDTWIWVVVRHEIDYLRPALPGETVIGRTWVAEAPRGARFDRLVEFVGADGRCRVKAKTSWAMLDRTSGRPARVPLEVARNFLP